MASNRRKLLRDPLSCDKYCFDSEDSHGFCPVYCCVSVCPATCKNALTSADEDFSTPHVQHHGLSLWLTLSLAVLATVFFFFICYTAYKIYSTRYTRRRTSPAGDDQFGPTAFLQDEDQGPVVDHPIWYIRTIGLQHSVINAITAVKYKKGDGLIDGTDCAICLNEFEEDESLRLLPKCNHAFHIPCIDTWLRSHTNCPMCRAGIVPLEPASGNPVLMEENDRELRMGAESEASELRIRVDDASGESMAQIGHTNCENLVGRNNDAGGFNGEQHPMRRSVSVDSFPASPITSSIANAASIEQSGRLLDKSSEVVANKAGINQSLLRFVGSFSVERSPHMGTPSSSSPSSSSVKRSLSCSAKVFLSRHSIRSHDSGIPPRNEPLNCLDY